MVKLISRIIYLDNKNTCIRLCDKEWEALDEICKEKSIKRKSLINQIRECKNKKLGLTAAIRLFILIYYKDLFIHKKNNSDDIITELLSNIS